MSLKHLAVQVLFYIFSSLNLHSIGLLFRFSGQFCVLYVIVCSAWSRVPTAPSPDPGFTDYKEGCKSCVGHSFDVVLFRMVRSNSQFACGFSKNIIC